MIGILQSLNLWVIKYWKSVNSLDTDHRKISNESDSVDKCLIYDRNIIHINL